MAPDVKSPDRLHLVDSGASLGLHGLYNRDIALGHIDPKWGDLASDSAVIFLSLLVKAGFWPVVEFGTFRGRTTYNLALNAPPDATIHTIDIGNSADEGANVEQRGYGTYVPGELILNAEPVVRSKVNLITADSTSLELTDLFGSVGLVIVDGGHSYEVCKHDSAHAFKLVRPGGMIVWDDYDPYWPGVKKCVDELAAEYPLVQLKREGLVVHRVEPSSSR